jgi:hypothetical protein
MGKLRTSFGLMVTSWHQHSKSQLSQKTGSIPMKRTRRERKFFARLAIRFLPREVATPWPLTPMARCVVRSPARTIALLRCRPVPGSSTAGTSFSTSKAVRERSSRSRAFLPIGCSCDLSRRLRNFTARPIAKKKRDDNGKSKKELRNRPTSGKICASN